MPIVWSTGAPMSWWRERTEEANKENKCGCGAKVTHFTIDGVDSVLCCDHYPKCMMDPQVPQEPAVHTGHESDRGDAEGD